MSRPRIFALLCNAIVPFFIVCSRSKSVWPHRCTVNRERLSGRYTEGLTQAFKFNYAEVNMSIRPALGFLFMTFSVFGFAAAKEAGAPTMSSPASSTSADAKFLKEAADGGMAEVELGQLASEKASSSDVKHFGQRMVED